MTKDKTDKTLDEEYLRSLMAGQGTSTVASVSKDSFGLEQPEDMPSRGKVSSRRSTDDYAVRFLTPHPCVGRQGVYINRDLHRRITALIGILGKRNLTVGSFIDNILAYHFEQYGEQIRQLCSKDLNKLF